MVTSGSTHRAGWWRAALLCLFLPLCAPVVEADEEKAELPGVVVLATGGTIAGEAPSPTDPRYDPSKLSVDVLLESVAGVAGRNAVGVLMTGMGGDGARGLLDIRHAGGLTITQDRRSCVVYGMPKVAVGLGASMYSATPRDTPALVLRKLAARDHASECQRT